MRIISFKHTMSRRTRTRQVLAALALLVAGLGLVAARDARATIDFTFTTPKSIKVGQVGLDYVKIHCEVTNTGTEADQYDILRFGQDLPANWSSSICVGGEDGFCQAPFVDSLYAGNAPCGFPSCAGNSGFGLAPSQTDTISAYFTPQSGEGSGYVTFRVRSVTTPSLFRDLTLGCVTDGVQVLLVDDDGTQALENYYEPAVPGFLSQGTWHRALSRLTTAEIQNFPYVVWFTGNAIPTLNADDRTAITGLLAGNRGLILSGQDIAYDLCDPASPNYSAANVTWYETTLKTRYVNNNSTSLNVNGEPGDPISAGLNLVLQGGDGANNQTDPDILRPLVGGGTAWTYQVGATTAATRALGTGYRAVNLGFGFEAISSAANRETVMTNALTWLAGSPIAVDDTGVGPAARGVRLEPARPNPFNPSTAIAFTLDRPGAARLRIVDAAGHSVRVLADETFTAGRHVVTWDGRDDAGRGMASGVYWAELSAGGNAVERVKLSLVR
jgi:hypothetical protein